ncbi:hypothetical protein MOTC310_00690 [Methylobacterium oryzae]|uniref:Uncharacterized protein n=1 Tax=Methylobacterium oryzae TaxID=334852 RepID=A0ABU7THM8_9HYPH
MAGRVLEPDRPAAPGRRGGSRLGESRHDPNHRPRGRRGAAVRHRRPRADPPDGPPPPPPPSRAAHIVLERGDARVDVKCADDDTTKACADVSLQMLDRLAAFRP